MAKGKLRQKLDQFTVWICAHGSWIGTGVIVSEEGGILTCAHVLRRARIPIDESRAEVGIYFPQLARGERKDYQAYVACFFADYDDDIVLLQLKEPLPQGIAIAILGNASESVGSRFHSYSFPGSNQPKVYAVGEIMGPSPGPPGKKLQVKPLELRSREIRPGMSGAAVLDRERNLVVGLISERWDSGGSTDADDLAWAVDLIVLTLDPFGVPLIDATE